MGNIKQTVSTNVKRFRKKLGLSRADVAAITGLHVTYIARIENKPINVSIENLEKLANALKIHVGKLVSFREKVIVNSPETVAKLDHAAALIQEVREKIEVAKP